MAYPYTSSSSSLLEKRKEKIKTLLSIYDFYLATAVTTALAKMEMYWEYLETFCFPGQSTTLSSHHFFLLAPFQPPQNAVMGL